MKKSAFFFFVGLIISVTVFGQDAPIPSGFSKIDSAMGDLDKDSIVELVVIYNTSEIIDNDSNDIVRQLVVYKKIGGQWTIWKQSKKAVLSSMSGGVLGDPYQGIEITKGVLKIFHLGGSREKWSITDIYRYQNGDFYLIGFTDFSGCPCDYWEKVDFNLSTGKLIYSKEYEVCENEISPPKISKKVDDMLIVKGLKITMENRNSKDISFELPKTKAIVYIEIKR